MLPIFPHMQHCSAVQETTREGCGERGSKPLNLAPVNKLQKASPVKNKTGGVWIIVKHEPMRQQSYTHPVRIGVAV